MKCIVPSGVIFMGCRVMLEVDVAKVWNVGDLNEIPREFNEWMRPMASAFSARIEYEEED